MRVPRNGTDVVANVGTGGVGFHWVTDPSDPNVKSRTKDSTLVVDVKHDTPGRYTSFCRVCLYMHIVCTYGLYIWNVHMYIWYVHMRCTYSLTVTSVRVLHVHAPCLLLQIREDGSIEVEFFGTHNHCVQNDYAANFLNPVKHVRSIRELLDAKLFAGITRLASIKNDVVQDTLGDRHSLANFEDFRRLYLRTTRYMCILYVHIIWAYCMCILYAHIVHSVCSPCEHSPCLTGFRWVCFLKRVTSEVVMTN